MKVALAARMTDAIEKALGPDFANTDPNIVPATKPEFGDFQANFAMKLAKTLKTNPRQLAQQVVDQLDQQDLIAAVDIAGPGFINITLENNVILSQFRLAADQALSGKRVADDPQTVVVDYGGPNVAKEMHVGHLRSTIIGDAIVRILEWLGHKVIRQNHMGDWGTQFGMLIEHIVEQNWDETDGSDIGDLNALYQTSKQRFDADEDFKKRARERVVALQSGDADTVAIWQALVKKSETHFQTIYSRLGVLLCQADIHGESAYNDDLPGVIEALSQKGVLADSDGAKVVYPAGFEDRDGNPMGMIVQKSDGGYLYATTDFAALDYRIRQLHASRVIYVTDARQSQHFEMLFTVAHAITWGDAPSVRLDHVPFGAMLGKDRKPFKTRSGETIKLSALIDEAISRAHDTVVRHDRDFSEAEEAHIAQVVGIGALKYADLAENRTRDYVFDWDLMLALDGNTAPYLLNAVVRIAAIFRKGAVSPSLQLLEQVQITHPVEKALIMQVCRFEETIAVVADGLQIHRLCQYLYDLAALFHRFYEHCPMLNETDKSIRDSRLGIAFVVQQILSLGLQLLGIEILDKM